MEVKEATVLESGSTRMHGDERRQQIIGVAMEIFSHRGFSGTTTREIAHAAGVSEAMVFKHFANKEELYSAILDTKAGEPMMQKLSNDVEEFALAKDDFGFFNKVALTIMEKHEGDCAFLRLMLHSALEGHGLATVFFERVTANAYDFFSEYIERRQEDGDFCDIDPRTAVRAFIGMIIHHSINNILWDRERKLLDISNEDAARAFTNIFLNGIKK